MISQTEVSFSGQNIQVMFHTYYILQTIIKFIEYVVTDTCSNLSTNLHSSLKITDIFDVVTFFSPTPVIVVKEILHESKRLV